MCTKFCFPLNFDIISKCGSWRKILLLKVNLSTKYERTGISHTCCLSSYSQGGYWKMYVKLRLRSMYWCTTPWWTFYQLLKHLTTIFSLFVFKKCLRYIAVEMLFLMRYKCFNGWFMLVIIDNLWPNNTHFCGWNKMVFRLCRFPNNWIWFTINIFFWQIVFSQI